MPGRRWGEGLHQAIEAKEGLTVQNETVTIASVTYQSFFRGFDKLGGMTGTAETEKGEFKDIYGLNVAVVPPNRPDARKDASDVVFAKSKGKWDAVVKEIKSYNRRGRPILVGVTPYKLLVSLPPSVPSLSTSLSTKSGRTRLRHPARAPPRERRRSLSGAGTPLPYQVHPPNHRIPRLSALTPLFRLCISTVSTTLID